MRFPNLGVKASSTPSCHLDRPPAPAAKRWSTVAAVRKSSMARAPAKPPGRSSHKDKTKDEPLEGKSSASCSHAKCIISCRVQPWRRWRSPLTFPFQIPNLCARKAGGISASLDCHCPWVPTLSPWGKGDVSLDNQLYGKDHLFLMWLFEQTLSHQWGRKLCLGLLF